MKYEYRGRNIEISEQLKTISEKKLSRLNRFFTDDTTVYVTYRTENKLVAAEITIPIQGAAPVRAEAKDEDKFIALEAALDRLEKQIIRYRKKLKTRMKIDTHLKSSFFEEAAAEEQAEEEENMIIRRVKTISAKPMDVSEACLQMELLGHDFFVFRNKETERTNIVYRRKESGTYGLIDVE